MNEKEGWRIDEKKGSERRRFIYYKRKKKFNKKWEDRGYIKSDGKKGGGCKRGRRDKRIYSWEKKKRNLDWKEWKENGKERRDKKKCNIRECKG